MAETTHPAEKIKSIIVISCSACVNGRTNGTIFFCELPGGPSWKNRPGIQYIHTCDKFTR